MVGAGGCGSDRSDIAATIGSSRFDRLIDSSLFLDFLPTIFMLDVPLYKSWSLYKKTELTIRVTNARFILICRTET